jgi:capsular exopolysaccharide synthesis family protein
MSLQQRISDPPPPIAEGVQPPEEGGADIWEYLRIIRRRLLLIVLTVVVVVGLTAFVTLRMTKIYRATTTIRIETMAPQVLGKDVEDVVELGSGSYWSNMEYYETQYHIIESRDVSARVVREFQLNEDPQFLGIPAEARGTFDKVSVEVATMMLQGMMTVEPVKDSRLVQIHVDSSDPERAQIYANGLAQAYVDHNLETVLQSTVEAVDWLSGQLSDAKDKLTDTEKALYKYKEENGILSVSLEDRQNIITAQMTEAATKLTEARGTRIELQARKNAVARAAKTDDPMAIPVEALNNSPLIQQLKQNYAKLSQEYGELSERYGDQMPAIVELKAKMARIRSDIAREVNNIIVAVDAELNAARATESGLKKTLEEFKQEALALNQKEVVFNRLDRDKENAESLYQLLMGRTTEADLSRLLRVNNVQILDPALLPEDPIKPRVQLNLLLAHVLGLILGIGLAVLVEIFDRTIKTPQDVEALRVAFLGIVPSISTSSAIMGSYHSYYGKGSRPRKKKPQAAKQSKEQINYDTFVHDHPKSQVAESLRSIRTNLLFTSADRTFNRLLVTSPSPQEGKTTVATNLAIVMAQSGSRVLLIDTDMRRPRLHKVFGIKRSKAGLSTMILGETSGEESIRATAVPNLDLLVCGPTPPNPAELLHTESFLKVIDFLDERYDRLIFDSPPVGVVTDAAILSKLVDGTLLIVKSRHTTRDAAKHAVNVLRDIDAELLGAVMNDLDLEDRKYGRYYYHYYKKYGYYYGGPDEDRDTSPPDEKHPSQAAAS